KRIIGGSPAPAGKYTFAVRLTITEGTEQFLCGGSLIADNLVVTAAHCLVDSNTNTVVSARSVVVSYGSYDNSAQKYVIATNLTVNPNYDARAITNDIALIQIPKLTLSSSVSTIPIYTGSLPSNTTLTTMGWGKTNSSNDNSLSKTLLAVDVKIGDKSSCRVVDPTYQSADGPQVCTVNALTPGKDSCQGDSGSPTIISQNGVPYLAALTSVGTDPANPGAEDCAMPKGVALYTHVNYFMSFITSTTG
ncbi:trypsin-like serine protease, partial [Martensiomyces pterosporus]